MQLEALEVADVKVFVSVRHGAPSDFFGDPPSLPLGMVTLCSIRSLPLCPRDSLRQRSPVIRLGEGIYMRHVVAGRHRVMGA